MKKNLVFCVFYFLMCYAFSENKVSENIDNITFDEEIQKIEILYSSEEKSLNDTEQLMKELLLKAKSDSERKAVYVSMVIMCSQKGMGLQQEKIIEYSEKALLLDGDIEILKFIKFYHYYANALYYMCTIDRKTAPENVLSVYLSALNLILNNLTQDKKVEVPIAGRITYNGPNEKEIYEMHNKRREEQNYIKLQNKLLNMRTRTIKNCAYIIFKEDVNFDKFSESDILNQQIDKKEEIPKIINEMKEEYNKLKNKTGT